MRKTVIHKTASSPARLAAGGLSRTDLLVVIALVVGATLLLVAVYRVPAADIDWQTDPAKARELARLQGKAVLLYFTAPSCPACRGMDRNTWPTGEVERAIKESCVPVKLTLGIRDAQAEYLARLHEVIGTPTVVLTNASGEVLTRRFGAVEPEELVKMLKPGAP